MSGTGTVTLGARRARDEFAAHAHGAAAQIVEHGIVTTRDREMGRRIIDAIG
jgi:hypothetical protein